jgi:hypothetical protein
MSSTFGGEMLHQSEVAPGYSSHTVISRPALGKFSGRKTIPLTTPKIVVVSPMPSASVRTAVRLNAGCARSARSAWRRSERRFRIDGTCRREIEMRVAA